MRIHFLPDFPKALIFDIDNTLYSDAAYGEAQTRLQVERLARERGEGAAETEAALERARADYANANGGAKTSLGNAFATLGAPIETSIAWRLELLKPEDYLKPDPRLIQCLKALSGRYRLAALTNNPVEIGRRTLACLGVEHFFCQIVGLDSCLQSKPAKAPFIESLSRLSLEPGECVSIGDRFDVDLQVPLELGMGGVLVDGVEDVYALPEILIPPSDLQPSAANDPVPEAGRKRRLPKGLLRCLRFLPLILLALAVSAFALRKSTIAYSLPLIDKAEGRLDARTVFRCFLEAYPGIVTDMKLDPKSGDWTLKVRDSWYSYANGRFMPADKAAHWASYRPYIDAIYPWKLVEPAILPESVVARLRSISANQDEAPPTEGSFAYSLYGGDDEKSVYARQVARSFLGKSLTVNSICDDALTGVEADIAKAAASSAEVKRFVNGIGSVGAYNWRFIRGQKELSRHSFGIAVDILPENYGKVSTYWQWDRDKGIDWVMQSASKRWNPPEEVVDIFERHGFIWGGKWLQYDTMHFEYHPELIRLRAKVLPWFLNLMN